MNLQTGIDLVEIGRLKNLRLEIRQKFMQRILTENEARYVGDSDENLAGHFAVKEAVAKALGTGIGEIGWRSIEVLHDERGKPHILLHGKAAEEALKLGLTAWSISVSHTRSHAIAVAVAVGMDGKT